MIVSEMIKNVKAECKPITNIDNIIRRWLDRGQKVVASKGPSGGWPWLKFYQMTLTTIASTSQYALSPLVDTSKIINFWDETSPMQLRHMGEPRFRGKVPDPSSTTGDPYLYRFIGYSPFQNQPTSASQISFVSDDAADTTQTIFVQGLDGSGILVDEEVALDGITPANTTFSYTKVLSFSKSAETAGKLTVTSNSGAVTNVVISGNDRHISHPIVELYSVPSNARTLYYDFVMKLPSIYQDNDSSLIPEQYHDAIELYAKTKVYKHLNNPTMAQLTFQEFELRIQDMKTDYVEPGGVYTFDDFEIDSNTFTNLPSMYPRD